MPPPKNHCLLPQFLKVSKVSGSSGWVGGVPLVVIRPPSGQGQEPALVEGSHRPASNTDSRGALAEKSVVCRGGFTLATRPVNVRVLPMNPALIKASPVSAPLHLSHLPAPVECLGRSDVEDPQVGLGVTGRGWLPSIPRAVHEGQDSIFFFR